MGNFICELKNKKKSILIVLLIVFLLSVIVYLFVNNRQNGNLLKDDPNALVGIRPGMSDEEIQKRLNLVLDENIMNITINPNPVFKDGNAKGNFCIENVKQNHFNYVVTIKLDDTDKEIYKSGLIRPNHFLENAKLDVFLEKGKYAATAYFESYRDNNERAGTTAVKMLIDVQN